MISSIQQVDCGSINYARDYCLFFG